MVGQDHGEFAYFGDGTIAGGIITLSETELHHLTRVRRARAGDEIMATDGNGMVYKSLLNNDGKLEILESLPEFGEPVFHLSVICGNLQGNASRDVVSFAVQMGVRELWWVKMARSQEIFSENKVEKLQRVAIQATKQTGRARLMNIRISDSLDYALREHQNSTLWVAHPELDTDEASYVLSSPESHCLIVGPEGGFADPEFEVLKHKANVFRLGNRRLRSETEVVAGLTFLLGELEAL